MSKKNPPEEEPEEFDDRWLEVFDYLKSNKGHELATKVLELVKEVKVGNAQMEYNTQRSYIKRWTLIQGLVFIFAISAVTFLTYEGKFNATVGVFFGTLVGYFFGKL